MSKAVEYVNQGGGLREAARLYCVPHETLRRRVLGKVEMGCKPGPSTIFAKDEEERLAHYMVEMADMGFGLSRDDVRRTAYQMAEKCGRQHPFQNEMAGRAWLDGFLKRNPKLTLRSAQPLSYNRAVCANVDTINDYFAKLGAVYARHNLFTKPMQIYNMDECGITIVHNPGKVFTEVGRRNVWSISSAEKGKTHTLLCCVSASGQALPPFMIYPRKRMSEKLQEGCVAGTVFACSDSGWVTEELYMQWFKLFISSIPLTRPVLLIEDGHSSHISIDVIRLARDNNIHLLCLPSHTTHLLQPLDVGVFKSLKSNYSKECRRYLAANPGRVITTEVIASILGKAWPASFTPVNIMSGFKKSGAFPLNPGEVTDRHLAPSKSLYEQKSPMTEDESSPSDVSCSVASTSTSSSPSFTPEQHKLYQTRYNEGFDLPDPDYKVWLAIYHPKTPSSAAGSLITHASGDSLELATLDANSDALSEVLSLPEPTARTKRKRKPGLNNKAITLTDDDVLFSIEKKKADKIQKQKEKEARKIEREQKKKEREEVKELKRRELEAKREARAEQRKEKTAQQMVKEGRSSKMETTEAGDCLSMEKDVASDLSSALAKCLLSDSDSESDAECPVCGLTFLEDDSGSPWVCCDGCQSWLDFKCTKLKNPKHLPKRYFCSSCK